MLLSIKDAPVHSLVDTLAGGGNGRGADGGRPLDRFGVDAHGSILTTYCEVAGCRFGLGVTGLLGLFFQLFLRGLQRGQVITRLDGVIGVVDFDGIGILAVRKGQVGVDQDDDDNQR